MSEPSTDTTGSGAGRADRPRVQTEGDELGQGDGPRVIGRGQKVFDHEPVRGPVRVVEDVEDVLDLLDGDPAGVIAVVRDAGATFLAPLYHDLGGVICTAGTLRSHIGIVTREFKIPCVMACELDGELVDGTEVELDCSGPEGVVRV